MRMPCAFDRPSHLDVYGRNLAARLQAIRDTDSSRFTAIVGLLADLTGIPMVDLDVRALDDGRLSLQLTESGLQYNVNQPAFSSGTLRALALLVAMAGSEHVGLLAIEEPENYLHPRALEVLVGELAKVSERGTQVLITSHSPVLLDCLSDRPEVVAVVTGSPGAGSGIQREPSRDGVLTALREAGFSLGDPTSAWAASRGSERHERADRRLGLDGTCGVAVAPP